MNPAKIILVDDHPMMRTALKFILEEQTDFQMIGEADTLVEAKSLAIALRPDLILLDLYLPDGNGLEFIRFRDLQLPEMRVVVLTSSSSEEDMIAVYKSGAEGFLVKNASAEQIVFSIRAALSGNQLLTSGAAKILFKQVDLLKENRMSENASLTKREMEILRKLANGFTSLMIANELNISESTLRSHYQSIQKKRNLSNHNQLLVYAVKNFT